MPFFVQLLIGLAINILAYLILPKPKVEKPPAASDLEDPVAEAGKPLPVLSGSMTIKGLNILYWGEKYKATRNVSTGGKK
jgi:hypothetical protein